MGLAGKIKGNELGGGGAPNRPSYGQAPASSAPPYTPTHQPQQQCRQTPGQASAYPGATYPQQQRQEQQQHTPTYPQQQHPYYGLYGQLPSYPYPAPPPHTVPPYDTSTLDVTKPAAVSSAPPLGYPIVPPASHQQSSPYGFSGFQSAPPPAQKYNHQFPSSDQGNLPQPQYSHGGCVPPPKNYSMQSFPGHQQFAPGHMLAQKLQTVIQANGLQAFYDPGRLQAVVQKVSSINFDDIAAQWRIGKELAYDLAPLALYDIVFYCDDSGSMAYEENGERINDLKFILSKVSGIATLFDDDGIMVRFMNSDVNGDGVRNAVEVSQLDFDGFTPLGTNFDRKVVQPFVLGQATRNGSRMTKPVLAIIITDGEPYGEAHDTLVQVIRHAKDALARSPYGSGALAVQIAQVGKDAKTQRYLESLDKDPVVGRMIDCTSYYEMEEQEFARKGVTLTPELWLLKMCVGAIDPEYDSKDD